MHIFWNSDGPNENSVRCANIYFKLFPIHFPYVVFHLPLKHPLDVTSKFSRYRVNTANGLNYLHTPHSHRQ